MKHTERVSKQPLIAAHKLSLSVVRISSHKLTLALTTKPPLSKPIPQRRYITIWMKQLRGGNMLTCECVNRLSGATQGLRVITKNLSRQHGDSGLSRKTERLIRSVACETHRSEWPPFRWKMDERCWHSAHPSNMIWVMRLHYKDREVRTVSARNTHAYSGVDI